ncbi:MAG: PepSY domain-containing protein [Xanthobacteraceae bacterium]
MLHLKSFAPALVMGLLVSSGALADGYTKCTKAQRSSWKPVAEAEAKAKADGYEVQRSKIEGTCYEVYAKKESKLYELFYNPQDLSLKHTKTRKN